MKILLVSSKYPPEYSGSGNRIHNTYLRLKKKFGINFTVITGSTIKFTNKKYNHESIDCYRISRKINIESKYLKKILNKFFFWVEFINFLYIYLKISSVDAIHVVGKNNVTTSAIIVSKILKKPLIVELVNYSINPFYYTPFPLNLIISKKYPKKSLVICISKKLEITCKEKGIRNLWYRPNPVNENLFNLIKPKISKLELFGFNANDIVILHLAKFIPRKKQDFMLQVLKYLPDRYKLVLAGPYETLGIHSIRDVNYFNSLENIAKEFNIQDRIRIIPKYISHPDTYMKRCDIFVLPSINEGLGTTILEALACGKQVITNRIEDVFDVWIKDGVNGKMIELEPEIWASEILKLNSVYKYNPEVSSKEILDVASTETIDLEYYKRMRRLIN